MRNGYRPVRASRSTSTRRRTRSNGVLLRPPDSAGGSASVASIAIASGASWRKTELAPRRPLPRTTAVNVVPRCPTNGCTDTALGSTRRAKAPAGLPIIRRSEAMRRGVIRSTSYGRDKTRNPKQCQMSQIENLKRASLRAVQFGDLETTILSLFRVSVFVLRFCKTIL